MKRPLVTTRLRSLGSGLAFFLVFLLTVGMASAGQAQSVFFTNNPTVIQPTQLGQTALATFSLSLSSPATQPTTVNLQTVDGSATVANGFYQPLTTSVTFPTGTVGPQTVSVTVNGTNIYWTTGSGGRSFTFSLSVTSTTPAGLTIGNTGVATIINQDTKPTITIQTPGPVVIQPESGTINMPFFVVLSGPSNLDTYFSYQTISGANAYATGPNQDYSPQTGTGDIPPGATQVEIDVPILGSTAVLPNQFINLSISNVTLGGLTNFFQILVSEAQGEVLAQNGPVISISGSELPGNSTPMQFLVSLSTPSPNVVTVNYATANSTAIAGVNYTATNGTLTFAPYQTTQYINVPLLTTNIYNGGPLYFTVNLNGANGPATIGQGTGLGTIDDYLPPPTISFVNSAETIPAPQAGNATLDFSISLSSPTSQAVNFTAVTSDGPGNGTTTTSAVSYQDYTPISSVVTIAPGTQLVTLPVTILQTNTDALDKVFTMTLSNATPAGLAFTGGASSTVATGTIVNTNGPAISVTTNSPQSTSAAGGAINFQWTLSFPSSHVVRASYSTVDGSAIAGTDYVTTSGTMTFPPGATTEGVNVPLIANTGYFPQKSFTMVASNPQDGSSFSPVGPTLVATGVINPAGVEPTLTLSSSLVLNAGVPAFQDINMSLSGPASVPVVVDYQEAGGTAVAGVDYSPVNGPLTLSPGTTKATVQIPLLNPALYNPSGTTFNFQVTGVTNAVVGTASLAIVVPNDTPEPALSISPGNGSVPGGATASTVTFVISLSAPSELPTSVNFDPGSQASWINPLAPPNGFDPTTGNFTYSATVGKDFAVAAVNPVPPNPLPPGYVPPYTFTGDQLVLAPGTTSAPVQVTILAQTYWRPDVSFLLNLSQPNGATIASGSAEETITNGVNAGLASISVNLPETTAVTEGLTQYAGFTITLSAPSGGPEVVYYTTSPIGNTPATPGADYTTTNSHVVIPPDPNVGATPSFTQAQGVPILVNPVPSGPVQFSVGIAAAPPWGVAPAPAGSVTYTETNADPTLTTFAPLIGNPSTNGIQGAQGNGTVVTLTGTNFNTLPGHFLQSVTFASYTGNPVTAVATVTAATTATVIVPDTATTGPLTLNFGSGQNSSTITTGAPFVVNPTVQHFTPIHGIPLLTTVNLTGENFQDPNNPITDVLFANNIGAAPGDNNGGTYTVVSPTQITVVVPTGSNTGPIQVKTVAGTGPASAGYPGFPADFTVDTETQGGVAFTTPIATTGVFQNEDGRATSTSAAVPIESWPLSLTGAVSSDPAKDVVPPRTPVTIKVGVAATNTGGSPGTIILNDAIIQVVDNQGNIVGGPGNIVTFVNPAGVLPNYTVELLYAGTDSLAPNFLNNGIFEDRGPDVTLTFTASISASADLFYPTTAAPSTFAINRANIHGIALDVSTVLHTAMNQNLPANQRNTSFTLGLENLDLPNPNGTINPAARPSYDVIIPLKSTDTADGLLSYYTLVPNSAGGYTKTAIEATPEATLDVVFATDPSSPEYYRNQHVIQVNGEQDPNATADVLYDIALNGAITSADSAWDFTLPNGTVPVINADDHQSGTATDPGYLYSTTGPLNTTTAGGTATFTARLRTQPQFAAGSNQTGNCIVTDVFYTSDPTQALLWNPLLNAYSNWTAVQFDSVAQAKPAVDETLWDTPFTITVQGQNNNNLPDGNQNYTINSFANYAVQNGSVVTQDPVYLNILPPVITAVNQNLNKYGAIITPSTLPINSGSTGYFTVALAAAPTSNVTVSFTSSNTLVATATATATNTSVLTFTPSNYGTPQQVAVHAVAQTVAGVNQVCNIQLGNFISSDPNYNGLAVGNVAITSINTVTAGYALTDSSNNPLPLAVPASVSPNQNYVFNASLTSQPAANVTVTFSTSNVADAEFLVNGALAATASVTFTTTNYNVAQQVTLQTTSDTANGNVTVTVSGTAVTADPTYSTLTVPTFTVIKTNSGGNSSGTQTYAANSIYPISFPYFTSISGSNGAITGTVSPQVVFNLPMVATNGSSNFTLYRFNPFTQTGELLPAGSPSNLTAGTIPTDYTRVKSTDLIYAGLGYLLQTGSSPLTLNAAGTNGLQAITGTSFIDALWRNTGFPSGQNQFNGLNMIDFPFNPSKYTSVDFTKITVWDQTTKTYYTSLSSAVAAGVMSGSLYAVDGTGRLVTVSPTNLNIYAYKAYFVQIYRDNVYIDLSAQ